MEERYLDLIGDTADILQIGSRNMQNFPLLTACAKTQIPIMLKRHYGSSLRDWLGAAEYLLVEGNKKVLLCEREFLFLILIDQHLDFYLIYKLFLQLKKLHIYQ